MQIEDTAAAAPPSTRAPAAGCAQRAASLRAEIRAGVFRGPTSGAAEGCLQGNLVILPERFAADFLRFCQLNPKPCPLLAVSAPGDPALSTLGDGIDIRTDVPRYRVFLRGAPSQPVDDLRDHWRQDLVSFVLGCSFSFEDAMAHAGLPVRHQHMGRNVPMYRTTIPTWPAGPFGGPMVVSMRPLPPRDAIEAILISDRYPLAHGAPVHLGDPSQIGIADLSHPDFGDPPAPEPGDIPVFWACGVTPQLALAGVDVDLIITHEPGHMLVTDIPADRAAATLQAVPYPN